MLKNIQVKPLLLLLMCYSLLYTAAFLPNFDTILNTDDWSSVIERPLTQGNNWIDFSTRRPLTNIPFLTFHSLFGFNLTLHYLALAFLGALCSLAFYCLLKLNKVQSEVAFYTVLLFAFFPGNYTHMWLTLSGVKFVYLITMIGLFLFHKGLETSNVTLSSTASVLLSIPLFYYEGHLGLICLYTGYTLWKYKKIKNWPYWIGLALLVLIFVSWRLYAPGSASDPYWDRSSGDSSYLIKHFVRGLFVLYWAFTEPLLQHYSLPSNTLATLPYFGVLVGLLLLSKLFKLSKSKGSELSQESYLSLGKSLLAALAFTLAGYIPIAFFFYPSLGEGKTRISVLAGMGFCYGLSYLLYFIFIRFSERGKLLFHCYSLFLLGYCVIIANFAQASHFETWKNTKKIWNSTFQLAPQLKDSTHIFFLTSTPFAQDGNLNRNWKRTPFAADWEVSASTRLLYNPSILGGRLYLNENSPALEDTLCFLPFDNYKSLVIVQSNWPDYSSQLIPSQSPLFKNCPEKFKDYVPTERILSSSAEHKLRFLVQP